MDNISLSLLIRGLASQLEDGNQIDFVVKELKRLSGDIQQMGILNANSSKDFAIAKRKSLALQKSLDVSRKQLKKEQEKVKNCKNLLAAEENKSFKLAELLKAEEAKNVILMQLQSDESVRSFYTEPIPEELSVLAGIGRDMVTSTPCKDNVMLTDEELLSFMEDDFFLEGNSSDRADSGEAGDSSNAESSHVRVANNVDGQAAELTVSSDQLHNVFGYSAFKIEDIEIQIDPLDVIPGRGLPEETDSQ